MTAWSAIAGSKPTYPADTEQTSTLSAIVLALVCTAAVFIPLLLVTFLPAWSRSRARPATYARCRVGQADFMERTPTFGVSCVPRSSSAIFAPRLSVESETSNTFTVPYWWHRLFARYRLRRTRHDRRGRRESCNFTSRRGSCRNGRNCCNRSDSLTFDLA